MYGRNYMPITVRKWSLGLGNVFTGVLFCSQEVCVSQHTIVGGVHPLGRHSQGQTPSPRADTPLGRPPETAFLLECILVLAMCTAQPATFHGEFHRHQLRTNRTALRRVWLPFGRVPPWNFENILNVLDIIWNIQKCWDLNFARRLGVPPWKCFFKRWKLS